MTLAIVVGLIPTAAAEASTQGVKVMKDGKSLKFDSAPKVVNGRTMVPYRDIAESINGKVSWDKATKTVTVTRGKEQVKLTIGSKAGKVNGKSVTLDAAAIEEKGRTLVPLRFINEAFGLWVNWNPKTKTVSLESSKSVKHAMGTTKLTKVPQRVVVLFNGGVDIALTLGVKPVGAVESWQQKPWYHYIRSQMDGVTNLGLETQPNIEEIAKLKPDLIIGSKLRHEKIYGQLSAIAPTIMTESVQYWKDNLKMMAPALNKEQAANAFLADWDKQVSNLQKKLGSKINTEISIIRFNADHVRTYCVDSFAGLILKDIGFKRPAAQNKDVAVESFTSKESIPVMDGDIIIDITADYEGKGVVFKTRSEWQSHPLWKNLNGVKEKKVYEVNEIIWNMSGGATAAKMMLDDLYRIFDVKK